MQHVSHDPGSIFHISLGVQTNNNLVLLSKLSIAHKHWKVFEFTDAEFLNRQENNNTNKLH